MTDSFHCRPFLLRQIHLHHLLSAKLLFVLAFTSRSQELIQSLRVLVDQLSELRILGGDLLKEGLNDCWVLLNHLYHISAKDRMGQSGLTSRRRCSCGELARAPRPPSPPAPGIPIPAPIPPNPAAAPGPMPPAGIPRSRFTGKTH